MDTPNIFDFQKNSSTNIGLELATTPKNQADDSSETITGQQTPNFSISDSMTQTLSDTEESIRKPSIDIIGGQTDSLVDIPLSAVDDYLEYLKKFDITKEQIFSVLDTLLSKGDVLWSFKLFNKIPVIFHVRPYFINDILFQYLEESPPKTAVVFNDIVSKHNLAGSLIKYNDNKFLAKDLESFNKTLEFIKGLPFIIVAHLVKQLAIFDRVIGIATSQWAVENFTKPLQEN